MASRSHKLKDTRERLKHRLENPPQPVGRVRTVEGQETIITFDDHTIYVSVTAKHPLAPRYAVVEIYSNDDLYDKKETDG